MGDEMAAQSLLALGDEGFVARELVRHFSSNAKCGADCFDSGLEYVPGGFRDWVLARAWLFRELRGDLP